MEYDRGYHNGFSSKLASTLASRMAPWKRKRGKKPLFGQIVSVLEMRRKKTTRKKTKKQAKRKTTRKMIFVLEQKRTKKKKTSKRKKTIFEANKPRKMELTIVALERKCGLENYLEKNGLPKRKKTFLSQCIPNQSSCSGRSTPRQYAS